MKKYKNLIIIAALLIIAVCTVGIEIHKNKKVPYEGDITSFVFNYGDNKPSYFNSEISMSKKRMMITLKD